MSDDYKGDSTSTGTLVIDGAATSGRIEAVGDSDWFAVTLQTGIIYEFALSAAGLDDLSDPYVYLRDADGKLLAADDDSGPGLDSLLTFTAQASGSFWVEARAYADRDIGSYELVGRSFGSALDPIVRNGTAEDETFSGREGNDSLDGAGGADTLVGNGGDDTLEGGDGVDILYGSGGNDSLSGGEGGDLLRGDGGDDTLEGGDGDDNLYGSGGNDSLSGGAGRDVLLGDGGDDTFDGGAGSDSIVLGPGIDQAGGGEGDDVFRWSADTAGDSMQGGAGIDTLRVEFVGLSTVVLADTEVTAGGDGVASLGGIERAFLQPSTFSAVEVDASAFTRGQVTLAGSGGDDVLVAPSAAGGISSFFNSLVGGGGNDTLTGGAGVDVVRQDLFGPDTELTDTSLVDSFSTSTLAGIEGAILVCQALSGDPLVDMSKFTGVFTVVVCGPTAARPELLGGGAKDRVAASSYGDLTLDDSGISGSFEVQLQNVDDASLRGIAGGFDNVLDASSFSGGLVLFQGEGGDDTLIGRPDGTDRVLARFGGNATLTDTLLTTPTGLASLTDIDEAQLIGDEAGNRFDVSAFTGAMTLLAGGAGNDTLIGRASGVDRVEAHGNVDFTLTDTTLTGLGTDSLTHIDEARLIGDGDANRIDASAFTRGTVRLYGESGDDVLTGGSGNDLLSGGVGNDALDGGAGVDRAEGLGDVDFTLTDTRLTGLGTDTLIGIEQGVLIGGPGDNRLDASAFTGSLVILDGRGGDDELIGRSAGVDRVLARGDIDFVLTDTGLTGLGTDTLVDIDQVQLFGYAGDNLFDASASTRSGLAIRAGAGNDTLLGGSAGDRLEGGPGADRLVGGEGRDTMLGGAGADVFVLSAAADSAGTRSLADLVQDFSVAGGDRLDLSAIDADDTTAGVQDFLPLSQGPAFSGSFGAPRALFYDTTNDTLYGNIDADSAADFAIRLPGVASLSDAVFV